MTTIQVKDATGATIYIEGQGAGTLDDPFIPNHALKAGSTELGIVTETAPASDTASSGLNGRLQRIAQRATSILTALAGGLPAALTGSGNLKTALQEAIPAGTNNIGDVDVLTLPADPLGANADAVVAAGAAGSLSAKLRRATQGLEDLKSLIVLAAGNNIVGRFGIDQTTPGTTNRVVVTESTGTIYDGTTALTVKRAFANIAAGTTDGAVVAAVPTKKIRVLSASFVAGGTGTNATFTSKPGGTGAAISPLFANAANGGAALGYHPHGHFETVAGEGLSLTTGAGSTTGVLVSYVEV